MGKFDSKNEDKVVAEIKNKAISYYKHKDNIREFLADLITLSGLRDLKTKITKNPTIMALELHIEDHEFYQAGKEEEKLIIAEALILDGLPLQQVMKCTELTLLQITELQAKLSKKNK